MAIELYRVGLSAGERERIGEEGVMIWRCILRVVEERTNKVVD